MTNSIFVRTYCLDHTKQSGHISHDTAHHPSKVESSHSPDNKNEHSATYGPHTPSHSNHAGHHEHLKGGYHGAKHQLAHRAKEKIGIKLTETMVSKVAPQLLKIKKRLGVQLLARKFARGAAIAVPAVGGIFGVIVTYFDVRRTLLEYSKKNMKATYLFGFASVFDVVDVMAHIYTALGLSGILHHAHIHASEELSLIAAIVATTAAIAGEFYTPLPEIPHTTTTPQIEEKESVFEKSSKQD